MLRQESTLPARNAIQSAGRTTAPQSPFPAKHVTSSNAGHNKSDSTEAACARSSHRAIFHPNQRGHKRLVHRFGNQVNKEPGDQRRRKKRLERIGSAVDSGHRKFLRVATSFTATTPTITAESSIEDAAVSTGRCCSSCAAELIAMLPPGSTAGELRGAGKDCFQFFRVVLRETARQRDQRQTAAMSCGFRPPFPPATTSATPPSG